MKSVFYWVNSCSLRENSKLVDSTLSSIAASDIPEVSVWTHDPNEVKFKFWLISKLLLAASKADYFVRFEDDIEVNKHIHHNIQTWSALDEPDFGMGLLYVNRSLVDPRGWNALARSPKGELKRTSRWAEGGQAQIFKSSLMKDILIHFGKDVDKLRYPGCDDPDYCIPDFSVSTGVYEIGKSVYLHTPSLVQHHGKVSAFSPGETAKEEISSRNFDPNWKRVEKKRHKARRR